MLNWRKKVMNDKLIMENYLLILKSTVEVYVHGTLESSNQDIRQLLNSSLNAILESQANTYDKMTEFGWYTVNNIENEQISETLTKIQNNN